MASFKQMLYAPLTVPDRSTLSLLTSDQSLNIAGPSTISSSYNLYLPAINSTENQYGLSTDADGNLTWTLLYYDTLLSTALLPSTTDDITFATVSGSANISVDGSNTIKGIVGGTDIITVNSSSTAIGAATQSTSTSSGALIVSGGLGIADSKQLYIGGNLDVAGNIDYTTSLNIGAATGYMTASNASNDLSILVTGIVDFTGNTSGRNAATNILQLDSSNTSIHINRKDTWTIDTFNDSVESATNLFSSSLTGNIKHIVLNTANDISYYTVNSPQNNVPTHIFFTANAVGVTANIDFGTSNLFVGNDQYRYLVFTESGQSAHIIYMNYADDTDLNGWRVFNAGAYVYGAIVAAILSSGNQDGTGGLTVGAVISKDMATATVTSSSLAHYPNIGSVTLVTTTAYRWNDWQGDIFDGWGNFYIYNTDASTKNGSAEFYFITFTTLNAADGTITTETQTAFGKTFTIKYGYPVQGIFVLDVSTDDGGTFQVGAGGNMGSDSLTISAQETNDYTVGGTSLTLYNLHNRQNNSSTEHFRIYVIPYNINDNQSITYEFNYIGNDNLGIFSKPFTNGAITYYAKTNDVSNWVIADVGGTPV